MISYAPFYQTLFKQGRTEYELINRYGISSHTLYRMKQGKPITTTTLDVLCSVLGCTVAEVISYVADETEAKTDRT